VQEAAYASLLRTTRQHYHQRIAQVLERQFPTTGATQPEVLAHHARRGAVWGKALAYYRQAGEQALARSAYREAVGAFEQALSVLPHLPETRATCEQAIDLRLALRSALIPSGDFGRVLASLREAEALAATLADPRRLGQVSVFLSNYFCLIGIYDQAIAAGQRTLALATASGEVALSALANQYLGFVYHAQGDYRRATDCFGQTVAALDAAQRRERFGLSNLPAVFSSAWFAASAAELGLFVEGRARGEEGLRIVAAVDEPASLMIALWGLGLLALRQGDLQRALPRLARAMGQPFQHA
jgi:tetratricopeptide (TPR) repeat protein